MRLDPTLLQFGVPALALGTGIWDARRWVDR